MAVAVMDLDENVTGGREICVDAPANDEGSTFGPQVSTGML